MCDILTLLPIVVNGYFIFFTLIYYDNVLDKNEGIAKSLK